MKTGKQDILLINSKDKIFSEIQRTKIQQNTYSKTLNSLKMIAAETGWSEEDLYLKAIDQFLIFEDGSITLLARLGKTLTVDQDGNYQAWVYKKTNNTEIPLSFRYNSITQQVQFILDENFTSSFGLCDEVLDVINREAKAQGLFPLIQKPVL